MWLPAACIAGIAAGGLAVVAGQLFQPLAIFPLLVGALLGGLLVLLARLFHVGHRGTLIAGALGAAAACVLAQHALTYAQAWRRYERARLEAQGTAQALARAPAALAEAVQDRLPSPPGSFDTYMVRQARRGRPIGPWVARGWAAWLSWAADGMLVLVAACAATLLGVRSPFCDRCGTWYRTVRRGGLEAETIGALGDLVGRPVAGDVRTAGYRMRSCPGGCGPTLLELFWEDARGASSTHRAWLDVEGRNRATALLDSRLDASLR